MTAAISISALHEVRPAANAGVHPERRTITLVTPNTQAFTVSLLRDGLIGPDALVKALAWQKTHQGRLIDILLSRELIGEKSLYRCMARYWHVKLVDPVLHPPAIALVDRIGAARCLRDGILPLRQAGEFTVVATAYPEEFARHSQHLRDVFGKVMMVLAPIRQIEHAIHKGCGGALNTAAETRVSARESCRHWRGAAVPFRLAIGAVAGAALLVSMPMTFAALLMLWAAFTLVLVTGLRAAAMLAALRRRLPVPDPPVAELPVVSIMVPMFKEDRIAARLLRRLDRIDYPRDRLDVLLVVEQGDLTTRTALHRADLPGWMRIVVVPEGRLKTKPRALNYALDLCRGSIIGVYDAEDAPAPDQLHKVVQRFANREKKVACLQGVLDFYNPQSNWLSRCFTLEYAAWFRIILPGLQRMGLAVPLGGTTLFFRRAALEELGGWDAHNVTEDADLGMRLARHGYRTELIETVTEEEANCRALPWVRQRSRWLKGYMVTWAVHMRDPALLWRQLGPRRFFGFQVLFLGTLSQFLLAPLLWSFWLVPLGLPHPLVGVVPAPFMVSLMGLFIVTEVINIVLHTAALRLTRHHLSPLWVLTLHFYFPLGALASYKALWEVVMRPFYWDKTSHGHFDAPRPLLDRLARF